MFDVTTLWSVFTTVGVVVLVVATGVFTIVHLGRRPGPVAPVPQDADRP